GVAGRGGRGQHPGDAGPELRILFTVELGGSGRRPGDRRLRHRPLRLPDGVRAGVGPDDPLAAHRRPAPRRIRGAPARRLARDGRPGGHAWEHPAAAAVLAARGGVGAHGGEPRLHAAADHEPDGGVGGRGALWSRARDPPGRAAPRGDLEPDGVRRGDGGLPDRVGVLPWERDTLGRRAHHRERDRTPRVPIASGPRPPPRLQLLFGGSLSERLSGASLPRDRRCGPSRRVAQPPRYSLRTSSLLARSAERPSRATLPVSRTYARVEIWRAIREFCSTRITVTPSSRLIARIARAISRTSWGARPSDGS